MLDAYTLWDLIEKESKTTVFTRTGGLDIAHKDYDKIKQLIKTARKHNIPIQVMTPAEVNAKFPSVTIPPEDHIAVYSPDAGILNANKAVAMFHHLAKSNGSVLMDNISVTKIYQEQDKLRKLTVVETKDGKKFVCPKCIITAGAWTSKFLKKINIDLPLRAIQTTIAYWPVEQPSIYSSSVFPVYIKYDEKSFIYGFPVHELPNMMKCCAHFGPDVDPDNRDFLPEMDRLLAKAAPFIKSTFKGVSTVPAKTESCMYTWTPDEDFIIDELPGYPGIFVGCGFSGHGFKLAPIVGKILSQLALGEPHPYQHISKQYFSIERFQQKSKM